MKTNTKLLLALHTWHDAFHDGEDAQGVGGLVFLLIRVCEADLDAAGKVGKGLQVLTGSDHAQHGAKVDQLDGVEPAQLVQHGCLVLFLSEKRVQ